RRESEATHVISEILARQLLALGARSSPFPRGIGQPSNILAENTLKILLPLLVEVRPRGLGGRRLGGSGVRGRGTQHGHEAQTSGGRDPSTSVAAIHRFSSQIRAMPLSVSVSSTRLMVSHSLAITAARPPVAMT